MRILLAIETGGGGAARHVFDLFGGLVERGHSVVLVTSTARAEPGFLERAEALAGADHVVLPMRRSVGPWDVRSTFRMGQVVDEMGPFDVVHGHSSKAGAVVRLARTGGAARVYTPHAFPSMDRSAGGARVVYEAVERALARRRTDAIIAVSQAEFDHALCLGIEPSVLNLVVNGVAGQLATDRASLRASMGLGARDVVVGFVGRLVPQKDPLRFVEALAIARRRLPSLKGRMIGSGAMKGEVEALRLDLGLASALTVLDAGDAIALMGAFDLLCMTSRYEAMPYVLLEGIANGLPIVATTVGGVAETVSAGLNGVVVPADASADALAAAIVRVAASSNAERARMSAASLERARRYTVASMVLGTESVYERAMERRR